MMPSKPLSTQNLPSNSIGSTRQQTLFAVAFLVIALIGFSDAAYLTIKHLTGSPVTCSILNGCGTVTSSNYSKIFGIPVALLGAGYYISLIVLAITFFDRKKQKVLAFLAKITILGLFASIYFVIIQAFVLKAYCLYCMGSALSSTILFILGMTYLAKQKKKKQIIPEETNQ